MVPTNHSQAKLFDKKFIALTLRDARRCDKCKREYDVKYRVTGDNKPQSCRPVLLNCGHNICENCIYQNRHNLTCAVCCVPIEFEHTRWLKKSYDLNFCLLGQLANSKSFLTSEYPTTLTYPLNGMLAEEAFVQKCSECEQAVAIGLCMYCQVDFCKRCFTVVHQNSKVLKKHKLSEFQMQTHKLRLPKEKICRLHKRLCDRYCCDCINIFCSQCVRITHVNHRVHPLTVENANHKDKIISFLETVKQTRENIRKAQQDARICENQLEDFATKVTLEVNDLFLELHNHLQLEERRILDEFKKAARSSQKTIHEALAKLADSQTTLNNMRSSLQGYIQKPPHNVHINNVIEVATSQLEQIPCQIQISEIQMNPFIFKKLKDVRREITNSYEAVVHDPKINIRIMPMYADIEHSFEFSSDRIMSPELTRMEYPDNYRPSPMSTSSSSTIAVGKSKRIGRITNIISPAQFYVQDEDAIAEIRLCLGDMDWSSGIMESVEVGEMYMVYYGTDGIWIRGVVRELKKGKASKDIESVCYVVFLLDYGIYADIPKKWFRKIPDKVKSIRAGAVACRLVDVGPPGENWSQEARQLMEEIIQNKPVQVIIQDTTKSPWNVELFTLNPGESISIREALLYTGLGIDTSATLPQKNKKCIGMKPSQVSKMKYRLSRQVLHSGEFVRVKVTHVENPQQFFVVKFMQLRELEKLESDMDLEYTGKENDTIYYAQLHMCCALLVDDKWYRGCVEEINGPDAIVVRLVDKGGSLIVNWRQLHVLKERFINDPEFSIECCIADIQPLQENDYEWTEKSIMEFTRMTTNPNMQMVVRSSNQFRYQVILNAIKKQFDVNIGAMLVKYDHALTTGETSAVLDHERFNKYPAEPLVAIPDTQTKQHTPTPIPAFRTLKRTPIQVIHINNPGEFYIHLVEHIPGILKFQEELQLAQEKRHECEDLADDIDWHINDHCMVLTSINESASSQWFRGVIQDIDYGDPVGTYVIFLRDKGLAVRDVHKTQLTPIDDVFDRICNAAILCHLACIHPTGGIKTWSHSSIDEFTHSIGTFESIGATIQGTMKNSSIPVVLWGLTTENNDPLAPCTTKYTNINKALVGAGLAHLVEKMDITLQMDKFIEAELKHGHQTLQDWYTNFMETLDDLPPLCLNNDDEKEYNSDNSVVTNIDIDEPIGDYEPVSEWLPAEGIEKTVFTAYPTYIDDEAIVYLHDAEKHSLLAKMRARINQEVDLNQSTAVSTDVKWCVGQPCLARYHLDNALYRAVIHRLLPDKKYDVRFIDYGNVETCSVSDLHKITAFPNIPIQAVRFRIDGIKPNDGKPTFSTDVLDLIHGVIVDKLCAIRVPNGEENKEIKKCSIRFDRSDLARYLTENGYATAVGSAVLRNPNKNLAKLNRPHSNWAVPAIEPVLEEEAGNSEDELCEFMKAAICGTTEPKKSPIPTTKKNSIGMFNPDQYRQMFEKMQNEKLYRSLTDADSEDSHMLNDDRGSMNDDDDDMVELEFSFRSNYWHADDNMDGGINLPAVRSDAGSNFDNFDPLDTSSLLSNFSGIEAFKIPQLPSSVKSFLCEVAYVRSATILHVFPCLSELEYRQVELARRIQLMARRSPPFTEFEPNTPCLARYSKDKFWYRAVIRSHNASTRQVKVFYVDFLNTEFVDEENVRRCPKDLLSWPLRTFEMKLFGLKPNPRLREKDVKAAVKKCLTDRTLYAKIIRERGKIPEICLFKSKSEKEAPVYEDLIVHKYLCKE